MKYINIILYRLYGRIPKNGSLNTYIQRLREEYVNLQWLRFKNLNTNNNDKLDQKSKHNTQAYHQ